MRHTNSLIVGAGPAGLMAATWMARLGCKTRIVDKRGTKIFNGQADGIQCRSLEILDSFGFADRVLKESNHMIEICMWSPGPDGVIRRSDRIPDTIPGISRFQQVVLHQGRIERFFLDHIKKHADPPINVERGVLPEALSIDRPKAEDPTAYPITVKLRTLTDEETVPAQNLTNVSDGLFRSNLVDDDTEDLLAGSRGRDGMTETVHAKYLLGCDGARSWTRGQLGFALEGEATDFIWGVLDIIPITDFPDIRTRCAIHTASSGNLVNIPRENKLTRLYIQLTEVAVGESGRADRSKITPDTILRAAQKILHPYKLTYEYCDWWTAYQVGQRVGKHFSDSERIFLAGDAVHTHSPKAGQGMNVSMQDCFNLGWKIGLCVAGIARRTILKTYESERRRVAQDLIDFDHRFARLFCVRPAKDASDEAGISMAAFKEAFEEANLFASGTAVEYGVNVLVAKEGDGTDGGDGAAHRVVGKQHLARRIPLGQRFPSHKVLNQSDARPWHFAELLKADGRFRVTLYAGDMLDSAQKARVDSFCADLETTLRRFTPVDAKLNSVIQPLCVHAAPRESVDVFSFPEVLRPFDAREGWDYSQIFVDAPSYHEGNAAAYEAWGIDKTHGCVVISRPDQYIGYIGSLDDAEDVARYFDAILVPAEERVDGKGTVVTNETS
ncbi:phenol hydroxylase [Mycena vitilis]|nr:phenol hydroxylase [Mycena vitilis]